MRHFAVAVIWSVALSSSILAVDESALSSPPSESNITPNNGPHSNLASKFPAGIGLLFQRSHFKDPEQAVEKESLLDDQYKPWGAASLPHHHHQNSGNQVILDKIDDELFTPNSEVHSYDQRVYQ